MEHIQPVLVKDGRINNITDKIGFPIFSGASLLTHQKFGGTKSDTQITFNCQIPSSNIVIDRNILIQATYKIKLIYTNVPVGQASFQYGFKDCFQAFPINSSFLNLNMNINNTKMTIETRDILPQLLRLIPLEEIQRYSGMCPCMPDIYANSYGDCIGNNYSVMNSYKESNYNNLLLPRGAFPLDAIEVKHYDNTGTLIDSKLISTNINDRFEISLTATFTEPLIISPVIFGKKNEFNNQGMTSIENINVIANIDKTLSRAFSTATEANVNISLEDVINPLLLMTFISINTTDKIPKKNILPYFDYPIYKHSNNSQVAINTEDTITTTTLKLNQIPELFIICVRKKINSMTIKDPNYFLPIKRISINFNNTSALLAGATIEDLWKISRENGNNQSYIEFLGKAGSSSTDLTANQTIDLYKVSTTGSLLVISPSKDLSLPSYLTNSSIGDYSLQVSITYYNNTTNNQLLTDVIIVPVNSGILINNGDNTTDIYTGLLTKQLIMNIKKTQQAIPIGEDNERLVGGTNGKITLDDLL